MLAEIKQSKLDTFEFMKRHIDNANTGNVAFHDEAVQHNLQFRHRYKAPAW